MIEVPNGHELYKSSDMNADTEKNDGDEMLNTQSFHRTVSQRSAQRTAQKAQPQHSSTTSAAVRAQYRELEELVPAPDAPIFSSALGRQSSARNSAGTKHPRSTRPTWNPEHMAIGSRSTEAETASILVGMQFTPAINEALPYGELKYRLESHSPDAREGPRKKKRRVEAAKENEKVVIDLTMDD